MHDGRVVKLLQWPLAQTISPTVKSGSSLLVLALQWLTEDRAIRREQEANGLKKRTRGARREQVAQIFRPSTFLRQHLPGGSHGF